MAELLPNPEPLWRSTLNWHPDDYQQRSFQELYAALIEINQQVNLTRITTPEDFWEKHLWDSLQGIAPWLAKDSDEPLDADQLSHEPHPQIASQNSLSVVDIGTGGGFPGIPVALAYPHWQVTLMDSTQKKIAAIKSVTEVLGLSNVSLLAERAEHVGHQPIHREAFDLALIRAVGSTNTCAEYALPLIKPGGRAVLYRGNWEMEEAEGLRAVLPPLGGKLLQVRKRETPMTHGVRHYVDILKVERTSDKFPRAAGIPAKTPLQGR